MDFECPFFQLLFNRHPAHPPLQIIRRRIQRNDASCAQQAAHFKKSALCRYQFQSSFIHKNNCLIIKGSYIYVLENCF